MRRIGEWSRPHHQAMTTVLNGRGISCNFAPAPLRRLTDEQRSALLAEPIVQELLSNTARVAGAAS